MVISQAKFYCFYTADSPALQQTNESSLYANILTATLRIKTASYLKGKDYSWHPAQSFLEAVVY